ncbi:MAG: LysR family transcriptional regulator [Gammaproteobacteria bacterium]|nr:LysR family transcriptional regulator [Pseudomonadales bacterium]MCP5348214.1 LysR family transcriptional regulator [Pseudomonadales bacterium]
MKLPKIPLEYWLAFTAVVDSGTYAQAAEKLNKSQSSVSYAISRLNQQLPGPVLEIQGRKARLTEEGEVLYRYASQLIRQAQTMEEVARSMAVEFEAEVTVALDVLLEIGQLICSLEDFSRRFPHTRVRILETSLSGTMEALLEKQADLVIGATVPVGFSGQPLRPISMIPVAAPGHPLFQKDQVDEMELRSYRQVVLRDSGQRSERNSGWLEAEQRWTVSHFSSSISIIRSGLAFGFLPRNWLEQDLQAGRLREISLRGGYRRKLPLYLMVSSQDAAGPATRALADILGRDLAAAPDQAT